MHPGGGAGGGTAHRLPALLSPQLGARRGRGAHGGGQGRDPMRGTHTVTMTPHAPAWGSQVPPCLPKPLLLLAPTAPRALPSSIRGQTAPGKPQPHLPKPHTNPRPHPMGHGDAPRAPPGTETPNPSLPPRGAQPAPRPLSCQPSVRPRPGSCHITILPRASRTTGGLWQEEAKKPQRGAAAAPPSASPCPRAVPSPTPKPSPCSSPTPGRERGWHHRHSSAPAPRALGEAPEGQEGFGDGPARPARPLQGCPVPSQRGRPGAGVGVGARRGAPEPSSEARRCTAETWEEPGVAFSLLSARFHGEHTLYSECHHFPWIVGQRERENDSPSRAF